MVTRRPTRSCVRAALLACASMLAALLAACSPDLRDGVFGCKTGDCPDGFYCHSDNRCHNAPETDASSDSTTDAEAPDDGSMPDAAGGLGGDGDAGDASGMDTGDASQTDAAGAPGDDAGVPYAPCTASADCGGGLICLFGPDPMATNGYCSETCSNELSCPMLDGRPGLCLGGECIPACAMPSDCEGDYGCYSAATGPMMGVNVCLELVDPALSGTESCQVMGMPMPMPVNCDAPAVCLFHGMFDPANGICSLHCELGPFSTECPGGGRCVEAFVGVRQCLAPCTGPGDCGPDLICAPFGPGGDVCIPAGWSDQMPPLPLPMPP